MNNPLSLLSNRKSIRAYSNQPVTPEDKETIIQATLRAPTAGNMMLYSVIDVESQAIKDRLVETCDHQPFIAKAPFLLLFLADYQRWYDIYVAGGIEALCTERQQTMRLPQEGDLMMAVCDTLIAAQTAVIAAESLGMGSCYIGDILENYEIHRELFSLPKYALPVTLVCFGYPTPAQQGRQQTPRLDKKFIVHRDAYHRLTRSELVEVAGNQSTTTTKAGTEKNILEEVARQNYLRKFSAEFSIEMTRSVQAMIRNWSQ
jgi:nitroreductase